MQMRSAIARDLKLGSCEKEGSSAWRSKVVFCNLRVVREESLCGGLVRRFRQAYPGCLLAWLVALAMPGWAAETFDSIYISEVLVESRRGVPAKDG